MSNRVIALNSFVLLIHKGVPVFSSLITTIARFEELGCTLDGIVKIKDRYTHFGREDRDLIPAFKMTVKEA